MLTIRVVTQEVAVASVTSSVNVETLHETVISPSLWLLRVDNNMKRLEAQGTTVSSYADDF